ncbi:MAG: hypothetical protein WB902_20825 [Acetobacteraceae bacterium]|jgi:hypothetical protein
MSAAYPSASFGSGHREFLSERGQVGLLLLAVVLFAVSIALALGFSDARVHRSPVTIERWHEVLVGCTGEAIPADRARGSHATIMSPSRPTTSA